MAHGDFSDFNPDVDIGSATVACRGGRKRPGDSPYWIEIEMVGEDNSPCPGEAYSLKCPDGSVKTGALNQLGFARVALDQPGLYGISFPALDKEAWEPARS
jgi:hypothetical protein